MDIEKLPEEQNQLQLAIGMRDDFIAAISHELRTPLNTFRLEFYTRRMYLESGDMSMFTPEKIAEMLDTDERQLDRLLHLINDIWDASRIRSGELCIRPARMNLTSLINTVIECLKRQITAARCTIKIRAKAEVIGCWDELRLEQVIVNLLHNALRHGAGNVVEIDVEDVDVGVRFSIRDHGAGIAPENQINLFTQSEQRGQRRGGRLGLGLFISDQIVKAHGGWMCVSSQPGDGATFSVTLPQQVPSV